MSSGLVLFIGDKNLSSWSLRAYLALSCADVPFEMIVVRLDRPDTKERLLAVSPSGKVPALRDGEILVWDSLAICEHVAERFPATKLWPEEPLARAHARSVACEMHSGFAELRRVMPMNLTLRQRIDPIPAAVAADIARVLAIWSDCRERYAERGPTCSATSPSPTSCTRPSSRASSRTAWTSHRRRALTWTRSSRSPRCDSGRPTPRKSRARRDRRQDQRRADWLSQSR